MSQITVKTHILTDYIHGGYEDAASVTLWIDETEGRAHLTAHSGSMEPLDGPAAPDGAPVFTACGKSGWIVIFDPEEVDEKVRALQSALTGWIPGGDNTDIETQIEDILEDFDLAKMPYRDWLAENEPETCEELYG